MKSDFQKSHQTVMVGFGCRVASEPCGVCGSYLVNSITGRCDSCRKRELSLVNTNPKLTEKRRRAEHMADLKRMMSNGYE